MNRTLSPQARRKSVGRHTICKVSEMTRYWVVRGQPAHTHFREALDQREEWIGPFTDYEEAKQEWAKRTEAPGDDSDVFFRIECIDADVPPACTD